MKSASLSASRYFFFVNFLVSCFSGSLECIEIQSRCPVVRRSKRDERRRTRRKRNGREQSETQRKNLRFRTKKNEKHTKRVYKRIGPIGDAFRTKRVFGASRRATQQREKQISVSKKIILSESEAKSDQNVVILK